MDLFNYIVIGSGPAGVAAARQLEMSGTCVVDIGEEPSQSFPYTTLQDALKSGDISALLGNQWEMLANLVTVENLHAKLRAADLRHVANGEMFRVYDENNATVLKAAGSYAAGGMSNAWGAQLFRYNQQDLDEMGNWPIDASELDPYYADLEEHIGISGTDDDMYDFLGHCKNLLPPSPIVPSARYLLSQYEHKKNKLRKVKLRIGRARLAVLTKSYRGYASNQFGETEFFSASQEGIYTARRTLDELLANEKITYLGQHKLLEYRELPQYVEVVLHNCKSMTKRVLRTKHLLLGCGVTQTSKLVLMNQNEPTRTLPFIDHPPTLVPFFLPSMFGSKLPVRSFPVQLVATLNDIDKRDMISFYYPGGLLWSDLIAEVPFPMNISLQFLKNLLGGMLVAQIWEPSKPSTKNFIRLNDKQEVDIFYPDRPPYARLSQVLAAMRTFGAYSVSNLASMSPPGWGFHYAASLPMRANPQAYETHIDGRLWNSKRIRIIDGCTLPSLPAKNHSLSLMANSARIADEAKKCGY